MPIPPPEHFSLTARDASDPRAALRRERAERRRAAAALAQVAERLGETVTMRGLPTPYRWPQLLADWIMVVDRALERTRGLPPMPQHIRAAVIVAALIGHCERPSGRDRGNSAADARRLPRLPDPGVVADIVRDARVWADFNGRNIPQLAIKYGLSERSVRDILDCCRNGLPRNGRTSPARKRRKHRGNSAK